MCLWSCVIPLYTRLFWRFCHVVTSLYFWPVSCRRCPNLVIESLSNKHGISYDDATSLKVNSICFKLYRTYSNPTPSFRQMLANLFWVFIVKDCIEVQKKKKKVVVLCSRSPQNVDLGRIFPVVQWRQRNVQKSVMHVQSCCFANLSLLVLLFCRSCCRYYRRRRCLSSLLFINVFALFPSDAFFDLERSEYKCGPEGTNASKCMRFKTKTH